MLLWLTWMTAGPTLLLLCAIVAWWFTEPKTAQLNSVILIGCFFFFGAVNPELVRVVPLTVFQHCANAVLLLQLDRFLASFVATNTRMLFTGAAVVWLLRRASQTLWKPVPELIGILGLEVPDSPDVSLTGIAADKATLTWTRAQPSRPVQKFLIQVNGVNVGEIASNQDNFIIVSGLKPDHFYNVRVIAVGTNNFQAGSRVIRLRTFARDGRPQLGNARLPSNFTPDEQGLSSQTDIVDENGAPRSPVPAVETAAVSEAPAQVVTREGNLPSAPAMRRNTVGRRHSPSVAAMDQPPPPLPPQAEAAEPTDAQMDVLGEKYKTLLRETEELTEMITKEEEDHRQTLSELEVEKLEKKKEQKKKEEQTEKLRREQGTTERLMRNALQRRAQKEKLLKEKQTERVKLADRMSQFEKGIEDMRKDQEGFAKDKEKLEEEKNAQEEGFKSEVGTLSTECSSMEIELKERRAQVKELEDARKRLPGGEDDAEWREQDAEARREWHRRERDLHATLDYENKRTRQLDESTLGISAQLQQIQMQQREMYAQSKSSGVDFGDGLSGQMKRRSRNGNSMSGIAVGPSPGLNHAYPVSEVTGVAVPGFGAGRMGAPPGFAPIPFMGLPADADIESMSHEEAIRALTGDAPLSPTAKALLPSHIFLDMDDDDDPSPEQSPFVPPPRLGSPANDPQSPGSNSNRSISMLSSPHGSSHNLPFPQYADAAEGRSIKSSRDLGAPLSSPPLPVAQPEGKSSSLASLLKFQRSRGSKAMDAEGPALGSLKAGQSQSFPRQSDEPEGAPNRRKLSLSSWNGMFNRNSTGSELQQDARIPPASHRFSARSIFPFGGSRATSGVFLDRDPSSPRPASIASSELPRPSTEGGGGIWGPYPSDHHVIPGKTWPWSPPDNGWSRNASRRPSIHGSPSALKTTLASADDEILDEEALMKHGVLPSQVGVIGSRPPGKKRSIKTLNPAAPTFMTGLFKSSKDKSKDGKDKGKDKEKDREKAKSSEGFPSSTGDMSPSDSRVSRDGLSVHTQTSVSESRESLTLDMSLSNTLSDAGLSSATPSSAKDGGHPDNVVKKLFRKGSSSKFSFTSRLGKKGPGSVSANSDTHGRSSIGDLDDVGVPFATGLSPDSYGHGGPNSSHGFGGGDASPSAAVLGRSVDSVTSSTSLGPSKPGSSTKDGSNNSSSSKDRPESRMSSSHRWFSIKKKGKEKESLESDRASAADSDGAPALATPTAETMSSEI